MRFLARVALPTGSCDQDAEVVLRDRGPGQHQRYVTHQHNVSGGDGGGFYWGHYHDDAAEALDDFVERARGRGALWDTLRLGAG